MRLPTPNQIRRRLWLWSILSSVRLAGEIAQNLALNMATYGVRDGFERHRKHYQDERGEA